jgi:fructokinase
LEILEDKASWLMHDMNLKGICVTKGSKGAFLYFEDKFYEHNGFIINVEDTVGAGDSFLATLIGEIFINKNDSFTALEKACAIGALVASKAGANCKLTEPEILNLISTSKR